MKNILLKKSITPVLLTLTALINTNAYAAGLFSLGISQGGETLVTRSDGQTLSTGDGLSLELGFATENEESNGNFRVLVGHREGSLSGGGQTAKMSTNTISGLAEYATNPNIEFGIGLTYHLSPKYSSPFGNDIDFDSSMGWIAEINIGRNTGVPSYAFSLRHTSVTYSSPILIRDIDASSSGIFVTSKFGGL